MRVEKEFLIDTDNTDFKGFPQIFFIFNGHRVFYGEGDYGYKEVLSIFLNLLH